MNIYALLSWYDEDPMHLRRVVQSLKGFADFLVAVDGAYATFPGARAESSPVQQGAISDAARTSGLPYWQVTSPWVWKSEIEKRAKMFAYGREAGATPDDWFLVIDADTALAEFTPEARQRLAASDLAAAEVNYHDVQVDDKHCSTISFRSMFRALPGLTVERTHWLYTVDCEPCEADGSYSDFAPCTTNGPDCACTGPRVIVDPCPACKGTGRRFLWHSPDGTIADEPALDLTDVVTLHHYRSRRDPDRNARALTYYQDRDARKLESAGDW